MQIKFNHISHFLILTLIFNLAFPNALQASSISTLSNLTDIISATKVQNLTHFKTLIQSSANNLQTKTTLIVPNDTIDTYSSIVNKLTGISSYSLSLSKVYSLNVLVISLEYKQAYKLTQALKNPVVYKKLTSKDLSLLNKARSIANQLVSPTMNDYEKEQAVHDYIIQTTSYDYDRLSKGTLPDSSYTAAGVLLNHTAVCEGYSEATKLLLNLMDIECEIVTGMTNENIPHAWNIVRIENEWYMLDTTFDDPITFDSKGKRSETLSYDYFNITSNELMKDHTWDTGKWPTANSTTYNYYVYSNKIFHNYPSFKSYVTREIQSGSKEITCYLTHYDASYDLSFIFNDYQGEVKYFSPTTASGSLKIILS